MNYIQVTEIDMASGKTAHRIFALKPNAARQLIEYLKSLEAEGLAMDMTNEYQPPGSAE
jgi:hypothetical protein